MPAGDRRLTRPVVGLLLANFLAATAALAGVTALGKLVYDLTHRELDLGLLGLAEFAPAALLVLVTGSVADRYDRRRIGAVAALGEAIAALAMAAYVAGEPTAVGPLFALVIVFGIGRAFAAPAVRSLPADVVPAVTLPWLIARYAASWQVAIVVGPVVGGFLYAADPTFPFVAMAALLVGSSVSLQFVRVNAAEAVAAPVLAPATSGLVDAALEPAVGHGPEVGEQADATAPTGLHEAMEGLRFIRHHRLLLGAISLDLFAVLFGGAVALLPAIAEDRLGIDAVGLGWLRAAGGLGAGLVTLVLALRPLQRRVGTTLLLAVAAFGVGTIVLGVTRSFVVAFVAMAALSGADAVSVFVRATLVPLVTPADKRGRVLAVENVFIGASNELGAFESGVAGQLLGTSGAVVLGGSATLAVAAGWAVLFPVLRRVDRFPGS